MTKSIHALVLILLGLCVACAVHAEEPSDPFHAMPEGTWQALEQAPGIVSGAHSKNAVPRIQVVFDPNCPYSAQIYQYFKRHHPHTPIRWTPVAYMRPDSYAVALAIFRSRDLQGSLDLNLDHYDFAAHRGGFPRPRGTPEGTLGPAQQQLQQLWTAKWGGFTPMIFFRGHTGRTFQSETDLPKTLDQIVQLATPRPVHHSL